MYNIVACRESELASLSDPIKRKSAADEFVNSVDNLVTRSPRHPKVAEAYFRSAQVSQQSGNTEEAVKRYGWIATNHPDSSFKEPALTSAVQARMEKQDWSQAQALSEETLQKYPEVSKNTKEALQTARTTSAFALADSPQKFLAFETSFPDSDMASKAIFNAILLARKTGDRESEEKALQILLTKYENSPEARTAHLEKAVLLDSIYEIDAAIVEYEMAIKSQGLSTQQRDQTYASIAKLVSVSDRQTNRNNTLIDLSKKVKQPLATEILLLGDDSPEILDRIIKTDAPNKDKALAHAKLSALQWRRGLEKEAQRQLAAAQKTYGKGSPDSFAAMHEIANALYEKTLVQKRNFDAIPLVAKNPQLLAKSFQKKAASMAAVEKSGVAILQYPSAAAQVRGLQVLSQTYQTFSQEMMNIDLPAEISKEERDKFRATMKGLADPLLLKADQALAKSRAISSETGFTSDSAKNKSLWPVHRLPPVPPAYGYDRESKFPVTEKTVDYLNKGIDAMKSFWNMENREIAANFFYKTLGETPNYPPALYNLAILHLFADKKSDFNRSISILKNAAPDIRTELLSATWDYLHGNSGQALEKIREYSKSKPDDADASALEILCLSTSQKKTEALQAAKLFVKQQNKNPQAHLLLAKTYADLDKIKISKFILSRSVNTFPESSLAKGEFAVLLVSTQEKPLQAKLIQDAAQDRHPENLARLSKLTFDMGETRRAMEIMKEALDLGGKFHPEMIYDWKLYQESLGGKK